MKRFYPHFLNSMNCVLAGLLTLLGFSCSDSDDDGGGQVEEYGCPHANYEIKGKVVNRQNNPIPNIQIAISDSVPDRQMPSDTIYTDAKGEFLWETGEFPGATFKLIMTDIDKDKNGGQFAADTSFVSFKNAVYENGSGWYEGKAKQEVTITMNEQINTEE